MQNPPITLPAPAAGVQEASSKSSGRTAAIGGRLLTGLLLVAAAGVPLSLLWDFSWESTIGVDLLWSPPHVATYVSMTLAGATGLLLIWNNRRSLADNCGIRLGPWQGSLGAWLAVWGALTFLTATLFDRWWQSNYGLAAGLWHPPQILKAVVFFAVAMAGWLNYLSRNAPPSIGQREFPRAVGFSAGAGIVLALITVVSLTSIYPNRQHSASFYIIACSSYPIVLAATARAGRLRFSATLASVIYILLICSMLWLLPLFPAKTQAAPIYHTLDHMMAPPFPLMLIFPAVLVDAVFKFWRYSETKPICQWLHGTAAGVLFFVAFLATQWAFSEFLLSDLAENGFFAGGGKHWPFFLKIDALSQTSFWDIAQDRFTVVRVLIAGGLAVVSSIFGAWIGHWMTKVQR